MSDAIIAELQALRAEVNNLRSLETPLAPKLATAFASAADTHTATGVWENVAGLSVVMPTPVAASLACWVTLRVQPTSANFEYFVFRCLLNGATPSEQYLHSRDTSPANNPGYIISFHTVFAVGAGIHTIAAQWSDNGSNQDVTIAERRLTVLRSG